MLLFFMPTLLSGIEDSTHEVLVWVVTPLAILALVQGYLRHRCLSPLIVGLTGLTFMLASLLLEDILHGNLTYHSLLMLAAGACLLIAHAKNLRKDCKAEGD